MFLSLKSVSKTSLLQAGEKEKKEKKNWSRVASEFRDAKQCKSLYFTDTRMHFALTKQLTFVTLKGRCILHSVDKIGSEVSKLTSPRPHS